MSTETIFRQSGRVNDSHTGIGPGKAREEYLNLFSRASYSTQNEWPYSSPFAGFYDMTNTSTGLILLNQRFKFSHLRGQIVPREKSRRKDEEQDPRTFYEHLVESEQKPKTNHSQSVVNYAGQNKYWHNRMCKGSQSVENTTQYSSDSKMTFQTSRPRTASSFHKGRRRSTTAQRRSKSAVGTHQTSIEHNQSDPTFAESLWRYYQQMANKSQHGKVGLQQSNLKEPTSRRLRQSGIYRNPALTEGQKLYLLAKCQIYDIENAKNRHTDSYLQVLTNRLNAGLHDPREFVTYAKFLKTPRPTARQVNTGFLSAKKPHPPRIPGQYRQTIRRNHSQQGLNLKDFTVHSKQSFSKDSGSHEEVHRLSSSSTPMNRRVSSAVRTRQHTKHHKEISPTPSESQD